MRLRTATSLALAGLLGVVAGAPLYPQTSQYNPVVASGAGAIPRQEGLERNLEDAPWELGILRFSPWLGIRDATYVDDQASGTGSDDLTATLGAGLRAYVRTGPKVIWAAHLLPEYVWWADNADKRTLNGRAGFGVFAYFNRLRLEASHRIQERLTFFSPEVQVLTSPRDTTSRLGAEIELTPRLALFGIGVRTDSEADDEDDPIFRRLDRREETARVGLRYGSPQGWSVAVGYEDTSTDFEPGARNLSSTGKGSIFELAYEGGRFATELGLSSLSHEPRPGSEFQATDRVTGDLSALWSLTDQVSLRLFGQRQLFFALSETSSRFLSDRVGAQLQLPLGRVATLDLLAQSGEDTFDTRDPMAVPRIDDVVTYGAILSFPFRDYLSFSLHGGHSEFDSNFDLADREVTSYGFSFDLSFARFTERLQLGRNQGIW